MEFKDVNFIEIYSINELSSYYKNIDFIFSNRLHVLLLSALNGATPIAYVESESNKKIIGLFKDLGLQSNIVYYNEDYDLKFFIENSHLICDKFYESSLLENQKIISIFSKIIRKDI